MSYAVVPWCQGSPCKWRECEEQNALFPELGSIRVTRHRVTKSRVTVGNRNEAQSARRADSTPEGSLFEGVFVEVLLYVHRNRRLIRDGRSGRPPRLSHIS